MIKDNIKVKDKHGLRSKYLQHIFKHPKYNKFDKKKTNTTEKQA